MTAWDDIVAAVAAVPDLPGANCLHMWAAFDPAEPGEDPADVQYRHRVALSLCRGCEALTACSAWFDSLPPPQRPRGVIAGRLHQPTPKRRSPMTNLSETRLPVGAHRVSAVEASVGRGYIAETSQDVVYLNVSDPHRGAYTIVMLPGLGAAVSLALADMLRKLGTLTHLEDTENAHE